MFLSKGGYARGFDSKNIIALLFLADDIPFERNAVVCRRPRCSNSLWHADSLENPPTSCSFIGEYTCQLRQPAVDAFSFLYSNLSGSVDLSLHCTSVVLPHQFCAMVSYPLGFA